MAIQSTHFFVDKVNSTQFSVSVDGISLPDVVLQFSTISDLISTLNAIPADGAVLVGTGAYQGVTTGSRVDIQYRGGTGALFSFGQRFASELSGLLSTLQAQWDSIPDPTDPTRSRYITESGLDSVLASTLADPDSASGTQLTATIVARSGQGVSRVLTKMLTGQNVTVSFIGDSGLEGKTVITAGNDCASRIATDLSARFGVTVTPSNRAVSGHTAYYAQNPGIVSPTKFSQALADRADLYVIAFGHNDIRSDLVAAAYWPGSGYPQAASIAAIEHMVRRIRADVPGADIVISNEWPYTGANYSSNSALFPYNAALQRLAALYGCGFADFAGALAALGVTGQNSAVDDTYIWNATTGMYPSHPNDAGHGVWAATIEALMPADAVPSPESPVVLPQPVYGAERWTHAEYVACPVEPTAVRTYGTDGYLLVGQWGGTATLPQTSTLAGEYFEVNFIGSECCLHIDGGTGQGSISIDVDGVMMNSSLALTAVSGQARLPITGIGPGIHRLRVTVLSGPVTFRGVDFLTAMGEHIGHDSPLITYTGTWTSAASSARYYDGTSHQTTTNGDSFTVSFIGTGIGVQMFRYAAAHSVVVTVDGVASTQDWNLGTGGVANLTGWKTIVSGLPYGRHTVKVQLNSTGRALFVSSFFVFDETRTQRPTRMAGLATTATPVVHPAALPGIPTVQVQPDDATSIVPPYVSANSPASLTIGGTANTAHQYQLETGRVAF